MSRMASCVAICWLPNGQWTKCVLDASNPCPHSHMRRLDAKGWIKPKRIHNAEMKMKCVMWNEQIYGLTINHSLAPLHKQERMLAIDAKEMEPSSKIYVKDVSWWMSIKIACRPRASIIARLSKEGCISLVARGNHLVLHINMIEAGVGPLEPKIHTLPKWVYKKYET